MFNIIKTSVLCAEVFSFKPYTMIILLSPAKTLDFKRRLNSIQHSEACFINEANILAQKLRSYTMTELSLVMKMSQQLSELTYERFRDWESDDVELKQAGAAFKGEAYNGLDMPSLAEDDLIYAQTHLRILSGMYGVLRPFDIIKPYRLDMGAKLKNETLYKFWKEKITQSIINDISKVRGPVINLASKEYFSVLDETKISTNIVTPIFKENQNGVLKTIVVYTKKARGMMARYIIENKIKDKEQLKRFNKERYSYNSTLSNNNTLVFTR